ncbi:MAG: YHS domain-containing protein [Calditrichaeota bacterium]|nr:YHS domain-containing protein [Calditrichota bacterium]
MPKDPVCGMLVDEKSPLAVSTYQGKTYYFCSKSCKQEFEHEPKKYQK